MVRINKPSLCSLAGAQVGGVGRIPEAMADGIRELGSYVEYKANVKVGLAVPLVLLRYHRVVLALLHSKGCPAQGPSPHSANLRAFQIPRCAGLPLHTHAALAWPQEIVLEGSGEDARAVGVRLADGRVFRWAAGAMQQFSDVAGLHTQLPHLVVKLATCQLCRQQPYLPHLLPPLPGGMRPHSPCLALCLAAWSGTTLKLPLPACLPASACGCVQGQDGGEQCHAVGHL